MPTLRPVNKRVRVRAPVIKGNPTSDDIRSSQLHSKPTLITKLHTVRSRRKGTKCVITDTIPHYNGETVTPSLTSPTIPTIPTKVKVIKRRLVKKRRPIQPKKEIPTDTNYIPYHNNIEVQSVDVINNVNKDDKNINTLVSNATEFTDDMLLTECGKVLSNIFSNGTRSKDHIIAEVCGLRSIAKRKIMNMKRKHKEDEMKQYALKVKVYNQIISDLKRGIISKRYNTVDNKRTTQNVEFKGIKTLTEPQYIKKIDLSMTAADRQKLIDKKELDDINEHIRFTGKTFNGYGRVYRGDVQDQHSSSSAKSQRLNKFTDRIKAKKMPADVRNALNSRRDDALTRNIIITDRPDQIQCQQYDPFNSQRNNQSNTQQHNGQQSYSQYMNSQPQVLDGSDWN